MDLIGIPHRIVVGERGLDKDEVEYKARGTDTVVYLPLGCVVRKLGELGI